MELSRQEIATALAALRFYQSKNMGEPAERSNEIHDIATDNGEEISLDSEGIDDLCEKINFSVEPAEPAETRPTLNDALGVCMILIAKQPDTSHRLVSPDLQALRDISEAIARAMDECEAIAETLYASVDIDGELTDRESLAAYKLRAMAAQS
jgi:hypothetical protein